MKKYYGHYLGVCICNNDPEKRGRVQVFVPHIMPGLYNQWNDQSNDISINCVGDNLIDGIPSDIIYKLSQILPWAEGASPIVGTSSPGNLLQQVAEAASGVVSAAKGIIGKVFDQSPAAEPVEVGSMSELFNSAASFNNGRVDASKFARGNSPDGLCGVGARSMIGAMTQDKYFANGISSSGGRQAYASSLSLGGGNNYLQNSGYYNPATQAPSNYFNDKSQWQIGDVITSGGGGGDGKGHIQTWTGTAWVSDHTQSRLYEANGKGAYNNFTLHRANEKGLARMQQTVGKLSGNPSSAVAKEATSVSGEVAAASPHQAATPVNTDSASQQYANVANPNTNVTLDINTKPADVGLLAVGANGKVDPNNMKAYLEQRIANSKLNGYVPADAAKYGVDGSPKSWANYFTKLSEKESGFKAGTRYQESFSNSKGERVMSTGLFQVSYESVRGYGVGKGLSDSQLDQKLTDPAYNIDAAIAIHEKQVLRKGTIAMPDGKGAGGYFASASMRKIAADVAAGKVDQFNSSASPSSPTGSASGQATNLVNNTDPHGTTITQNLNGMAKGLFTYPAAGAMLWVFFREGNPLFPVYFAASYSQEEWKSAYRYGSDGPGYRPASTPDNPTTSTGGVMNLNGVGGIRWEDTNNPENRLQDQKSIMFFGEDGSNIFMGKGYNQFFSKFDRRDQVEGDRWNTTLGFKEEWVQGDNNSVTMGDVIVKIGNVSQPAVDAVQRIQQLITECQAPLSETSGSSSGTGGGGSSGSIKEKHNTPKQNAFQKELDKIEHQESDRYTMSPSEYAKKHGLAAFGRIPSSNTATAPSQTMKSFTNAGTATGSTLPSGPISVPQGALRTANTST